MPVLTPCYYSTSRLHCYTSLYCVGVLCVCLCPARCAACPGWLAVRGMRGGAECLPLACSLACAAPYASRASCVASLTAISHCSFVCLFAQAQERLSSVRVVERAPARGAVAAAGCCAARPRALAQRRCHARVEPQILRRAVLGRRARAACFAPLGPVCVSPQRGLRMRPSRSECVWHPVTLICRCTTCQCFHPSLLLSASAVDSKAHVKE